MITSQEKPDNALRPGRLFFLGSLILLLGLVPLCVVLAGIQLWHDQEYRKRARTQSQRLILLPAPRGNIVDRNGKLIVGNRPCCNVVADLSGMQEEIKKERERLVKNHLIIERLTNPEASLGKDKQQEISGIAIRNVLQGYLDKTNRLFGRNDVIDVKKITDHARDLKRRALPFTLVSDISENDLAKFAENFPPNSPVRVSFESVRAYPYGSAAAHVLGYLREDRNPADSPKDFLAGTEDIADPTAELLAEFLEQPTGALRSATLKKYNGLRPDASGLEYRFDKDILEGTPVVQGTPVLQGKPGYEFWTVRPNQYLYEKIDEKAPQQGTELRTSLDIDLQVTAEKSLARRVPGHDAAVVVLDVKTGEVLVMASAPTFDPARAGESKYYQEFTKTVPGGWMNRATQGRYPPGSTFKPITAIAGMRAKVLTADEEINCPAYITVGDRKYREHNTEGYGFVNLAKMLEVSCNVYCYQVGLRIAQAAGNSRLPDEITRFGLDTKSEIEIGAARGIAASPEYKKRSGAGGWSLADTVTTAIGQNDTLTTPLNIACFYASLARNETRTIPTLIHNPANAELRRVNHGGERIGITDEQYMIMLRGFIACGNEGRGTGRLVSGAHNGVGIIEDRSMRPVPLPELNIAAKTGTAQKMINGKMSHIAWVGAFAPAYAPRVAICVMVDEGENADRELAGGKTAGPIANDVLAEWKRLYFDKPTPLNF